MKLPAGEETVSEVDMVYSWLSLLQSHQIPTYNEYLKTYHFLILLQSTNSLNIKYPVSAKGTEAHSNST